MEGVTSNNHVPERISEPFLTLLWDEYEIPGNPPLQGSVAEQRLKSVCERYANALDSGVRHHAKTLDFKRSDTSQRQLHNELALMLLSRQRSGMEISTAEHIAQFAFEYARGYKLKEGEAFKRE